MNSVAEDLLEQTPDNRPVWRREYDNIMERFDAQGRRLEELLAPMAKHCREAADNSLKAYQMAHTALWMKSSWAPYIVSALAFAMSFAALVAAVRK